MTKNKYIFFFLILLTQSLFAESSESLKAFIKGSIQEKTFIVRQSIHENTEEISIAAINFALENCVILKDDRDLAALAVAGILSLPKDFASKIEDEEKIQLSNNLLTLYLNFNDETVKTSILNKITQLEIPSEKFVSLLNNYLKNADPQKDNPSIIKSSIQTLSAIGDDVSFQLLFRNSSNPVWENYEHELETGAVSLAEKNSMLMLNLIHNGTLADCRKILNIITKDSENSNVFSAEIAENILARTIYIVEDTESVTTEIISLQLDSYSILTDLNWTRGSHTIMAYFNLAEREYDAKALSEDNFIYVINGLPKVAPFDSVQALSDLLSIQNKFMEKNSFVQSENVVLALISALGTIGDKSAFDPLLEITYFSYSDKVIAEARNALAKLKW